MKRVIPYNLRSDSIVNSDFDLLLFWTGILESAIPNLNIFRFFPHVDADACFVEAIITNDTGFNDIPMSCQEAFSFISKENTRFGIMCDDGVDDSVIRIPVTDRDTVSIIWNRTVFYNTIGYPQQKKTPWPLCLDMQSFNTGSLETAARMKPQNWARKPD